MPHVTFHSRNMLTTLCQAVLDGTVASFYTNRAIAYAKMEEYTAALGDFQQVSTMKTYRPSAKVLVHKARCLFFLGSRSTALLALRDALFCDPANETALVLKNHILELESHMDAYVGAWSRQHWRMARSSYESCLTVYAQECGDAPIEVRCWGIELLIVESDWDAASQAAKFVFFSQFFPAFTFLVFSVTVFVYDRNQSLLRSWFFVHWCYFSLQNCPMPLCK